jgi:hypothetical protein
MASRQLRLVIIRPITHPSTPAGNSSLLSNMNGMSSEGAEPTGRRYGSVIIYFSSSLSTSEPPANMYAQKSIDLLSRTSIRPVGRNTLVCHDGYYEPDQLSGKHHVSRPLPHSWDLTSHDAKVSGSFIIVSIGTFPHAVSRSSYSSRCLPSCLYPPLRYSLFFTCASLAALPTSPKFGAHWDY